MEMKKASSFLIIALFLLFSSPVRAGSVLAEGLKGRILIQVQAHGEAWYVDPQDLKRYYLGRPTDAFELMRNLSRGITNTNLERIPVGVLPGGPDQDGDGLPDALENALGTNPGNKDTDGDGYDDKSELENGFNPEGSGKLPIDPAFTLRNDGLIFLQVENHGEAWYVNPGDKRRYFLGRPEDAFTAMKKFGLGITDADLNKIAIGSSVAAPVAETEPLQAAAEAIRKNDLDLAVSYFDPGLERSIRASLKVLNDENRLTFANILSGASLSGTSDSEKVYSNSVYFSLGGYNVTLKFHEKRQADGRWLIMNL